MELGKQAELYGDISNKASEYFQQAAALRPDNPKAQGLFALTQAMLAEDGGREAGAAVQTADRAARIALALDPDEPNARLALVTLQRSTLDLATNEDRLREILAVAPDNIETMGSLWELLQSAGRSRDALALVERANALEPFAAGNHFPKAQLLWILGRNAEADRVIDRAMQYWPEHPIVRFARFTIYAYTGRPRAALAMLDDPKTRPQLYSPEEISLWRVSLAALDQRTPASIAAARSANIEAARQNPGRSNHAILVLSALGEVDAAFEIANGLLLFRRPTELRTQAPAKQPPVKSTGWRSRRGCSRPRRADARRSALQCAVRRDRADRILGQARDQARLSARHHLEARFDSHPDFARILQHGSVGVALDEGKFVEQIARISEQRDPAQPIFGARIRDRCGRHQRARAVHVVAEIGTVMPHLGRKPEARGRIPIDRCRGAEVRRAAELIAGELGISGRRPAIRVSKQPEREARRQPAAWPPVELRLEPVAARFGHVEHVGEPDRETRPGHDVDRFRALRIAHVVIEQLADALSPRPNRARANSS